MSGAPARSAHRVALTGGIGTGKSYVRRYFASRGVATIDADTLARAALEPGTAGHTAAVARFGPGILDATGNIHRPNLAAIVFGDGRARLDLEAIVHPAVRAAIDRWFEALDSTLSFAVADVPLLYETGRDRDFEVVVVAACEAARQVERVMERDGLSLDEVRRRMAAQWPIGDKVTRADYVIRTDGPFSDTDAQAQAVVDALRQRFDQRPGVP